MTQGASDVVIGASRRGGRRRGASSPDARVIALQRELATARLSYTDKHPEVVRLQDELATARKDAAADRQRPVVRSHGAAPDRPDLPAARRPTARLSRLRIRELERADADVRRQIGVYQARVESAPMVEQQLASVQRDYDLEKQQYVRAVGEAAGRRRSPRTSSATAPASSSRCSMPRRYPTEPSKPIPLRVMLLAIVGGICLGGALMLGREYLRPLRPRRPRAARRARPRRCSAK